MDTMAKSKAVAIIESSPEAEVRVHDGTEWVFYEGEPICELGRKRALDNDYVFPEPGYKHGRCKMIKTDGDRCKNPVRAGWTVCRYHGAGSADKPGGLTNTQVRSGRYSPHLPDRLATTFATFLEDWDSLSLAPEMALIDTRIAERLEQLDGADVKAAWAKVRAATVILERCEGDMKALLQAIDMIYSAMKMKGADSSIWDEITKLVDARRKLAETERRRIADAQRTMTEGEAMLFVQFVLSSVTRHVVDPVILRQIHEDLKQVM